MTPEQRIDAALDSVLKASGSALRHYTMPKTLADMREAMRKAMFDEYIRGLNESISKRRPPGDRDQWRSRPVEALVSTEKATMNTWPDGRRHAISQDEHERWNARHYPGTRQLCTECDAATGRCEDDSLYAGEDGERGPLCEDCWQKEHDDVSANAEITGG